MKLRGCEKFGARIHQMIIFARQVQVLSAKMNLRVPIFQLIQTILLWTERFIPASEQDAKQTWQILFLLQPLKI